MSLPSSNPIKLSEVIAEFGTVGLGPLNLGSYYKQADGDPGYVHSWDHAPNVPLASSGDSIKLSQFLGAYKVTTYATVSPTAVAGIGDGDPGWVQSDTATVTAHGFHAPSTTYSWAKIDGLFIAHVVTGSQIYFRDYMNMGESRIAVYRCTVRDLLENEAYVDLGVEMINY